MTGWKLDSNLLTFYLNDVPHKLAGSDILDIEDGRDVIIDGYKVPRVSSELPDINFSQALFFSTVKATIYTPITKNDNLPYCQFEIVDPAFRSHSVPFLVSDYVVSDGLFLIVDKEQASNLEALFTSHASGAIGFRQIALIQKTGSNYISFEASDEHCLKRVLDDIKKSNTRSVLFPYQLQGVEWMDTVIGEDTGFVLADEMGLGKTVQIITVIDEQRAKGPSLLIAPNSLLENWSREIKRFAPWLSFTIDAGKTREFNYRRLLQYNLVITSYDIARIDFAVFISINWNLIVLDEAQMIKNYGAYRSKEIKKFPKRSGIAVTGTPLENRLTDIWSIYDFCFPSLLGTVKEFKAEFSDESDSAEKLEKIISPLMLRRRVREVRNDLPDTVIIPVALDMNPKEAEGYERFRIEYTEENGFCIGVINKLRRYCALPELVDPSFSEISPAESSAKFAFLFDSILDEVFCLKEKVIIFTEAIGAQERICENIRGRYGAPCELLNGGTPQENRQKVLDAFSDKIGFAVLIINPEVGATGLNITAANHVVFYTLEWNPAKEDQCIARAARIGQKKTVIVHRLFYLGTVEEEVNDCLERKRLLQDVTVKGTSADTNPDINKALQRSPFLRGK